MAVVYIVVAGLWIAFSDQLLAGLSQSAGELSRWQTVKGWFFVLATGGLLFVYLNRCLRRQYEAFNRADHPVRFDPGHGLCRRHAEL